MLLVIVLVALGLLALLLFVAVVLRALVAC
jgi:hypothetical protein